MSNQITSNLHVNQNQSRLLSVNHGYNNNKQRQEKYKYGVNHLTRKVNLEGLTWMNYQYEDNNTGQVFILTRSRFLEPQGSIWTAHYLINTS